MTNLALKANLANRFNVVFPLLASEDPNLTCIVCGAQKTELMIEIEHGDECTWFGVHADCCVPYAEPVRETKTMGMS
jgi:hypothetical protein